MRVSNSERAAASSRATRSRSVTSSDTPPIPTIRSSASRTGNFSDQTWRALPVRASRHGLVEAHVARRC